MYPADVLRVMIGIEQSQKGRNPPARRRVLTLARRKGARNHREECAINERIAVDEEESRAFRTFHEVNIKRPRPERTRASKSCGDPGRVRLLSLVTSIDGKEVRLIQL